MADDAARRDWERAVAEALARAPERVPRFQTSSGIEVGRVYGPEDLSGFTPTRDLGLPGRFPFTRGVH